MTPMPIRIGQNKVMYRQFFAYELSTRSRLNRTSEVFFSKILARSFALQILETVYCMLYACIDFFLYTNSMQ